MGVLAKADPLNSGTSPMSLTILFEDAHLIAIDKPSLIHSVSLETNDRSIATEILEKFPELRTAAEKEGDAGLINRLDFETSGILIAAKTHAAWIALRDQFQRQEIIKSYRAVLHGIPDCPLLIEGYIGNRYRGSKKVTFQDREDKRFMFSRSKIRSAIALKDQNRSLASIEALTGARHQVRAHCAHIGHPLVGDTLYCDLEEPAFDAAPNTPPFLLHAARFEFFHPQTRARISIESPLPGYYPSKLQD